MIGLFCFALAVLASPFKSKLRLEAENAVLRHQLIVLRRSLHGRVRLTNNDRWFLVKMYRWFPSILKVVTIVQPETLLHWHRAGFRRYWRWKSNSRGGRPRIEMELRVLIRWMSTENQLWGAPRIHGELLKIGLSVTGVAVLTAFDEQGDVCGMTANSFVTVSLKPPTVLVSVMPGRMHQAISASGRYGVNVLPEGGRGLSKHFSSRPTSGASADHDVVDGLPRLSSYVAFFACEVIRHLDVSDHTLFIAEVSNCDYCDNSPLVFFSSRYHLGLGTLFDR